MTYYQSVNGQECSRIEITDRGLAYGDGVFTTARVLDGAVELLNQHLLRLTSSCEKLRIPLPDLNLLSTELARVASRFDSAVAKVIITAGQGGRGYSRQGVGAANIILSFHPFPQQYYQWRQQGITLDIADFKLGINPSLAGIKHLNRLEQVLLRQELDNKEIDELIVTDCEGHIIGSSCGNVFWFKDGQWYTPEIFSSGIAGLMRKQVLKKFSANGNNKTINIVNANLAALVNVEAIAICNCVMGVVPVNVFQTRKLTLAPCFELAQM